MNTIQSSNSDSTINVDYDDQTNTVEIHLGNITGFRFLNLTYDKCEDLINVLNEYKNQIV